MIRSASADSRHYDGEHWPFFFFFHNTERKWADPRDDRAEGRGATHCGKYGPRGVTCEHVIQPAAGLGRLIPKDSEDRR